LIEHKFARTPYNRRTSEGTGNLARRVERSSKPRRRALWWGG
jgi:hypothetical protein